MTKPMRRPDARPIQPMHASMRGSQMWRRPPPNMASITLDDGLRFDITNIALSIFTDCVNSGKTFQDAILAVYLSGLENGIEASRDAGDRGQSAT
jgi:hypothetical protein